MDTVTYPNPKTAEFVNRYMIAVRVYTNSVPPWASRFVIQYTPTVLTLDGDGKEHHRTVGFLPPEEFIPSLMLGMGKAHFDAKEFAKVRAILEWLLTEFPHSQAAPAASDLKRRIS
jgi:thioredoxin-related protein